MIETIDYGMVEITINKYSCIDDQILDCIQTSDGNWYTIYKRAGRLLAYLEEDDD